MGVTFDECLNIAVHIQNVISKANQMAGIIKQTFTLLDRESILKLYKTLVRPHLEYGNSEEEKEEKEKEVLWIYPICFPPLFGKTHLYFQNVKLFSRIITEGCMVMYNKYKY